MRPWLAWFWCAFLVLASKPAAADDRVVRLALIVGVNQSVDRDTPALRFADDDAARYFDLFDALGTRTRLLTRMDENTRRLHGNALAHAQNPVSARFDEAVAVLAKHAAAARNSGATTILYFVYAGHGNVKNGAGYISLEDARLTGSVLEARVLDAIRPNQAHFMVDACNSYYLAYTRGPGGQRRKVSGFTGLGSLGQRPEVGVLLSTSSARESHEWERVQAGVFSHEVRSGLYGAADADRDGRISYREIAAFVQRANAAIPNDRYRPDVYARPPAGGAPLLVLREGLRRRIEVDATASGHYLLEDPNGVYLAEFHNGPRQSVHLLRPRVAERLYLKRQDGKEFVIESPEDVVRTASLVLEEPQHAMRGAAHEAFSRMFELPFSRATVQTFEFRPLPLPGPDTGESQQAMWRSPVGYGLLGLSAASGIFGGVMLRSAHQEPKRIGADTPHAAVYEANERIRRANLAAGVGFGIGAAAAVSGLMVLLWPEAPAQLEANVSGEGVGAILHTVF